MQNWAPIRSLDPFRHVINNQSFKVLLYPFTSLLAEFGGCLGLFLGFSFVTISDGVKSLAIWLKKNINKIWLRKKDHRRMNVALDHTMILGQQIFLDHRSFRSIDQKIFWVLFITFCLIIFLCFCFFVLLSMLHSNKVYIDDTHVRDICWII